MCGCLRGIFFGNRVPPRVLRGFIGRDLTRLQPHGVARYHTLALSIRIAEYLFYIAPDIATFGELCSSLAGTGARAVLPAAL